MATPNQREYSELLKKFDRWSQPLQKKGYNFAGFEIPENPNKSGKITKEYLNTLKQIQRKDLYAQDSIGGLEDTISYQELLQLEKTDFEKTKQYKKGYDDQIYPNDEPYTPETEANGIAEIPIFDQIESLLQEIPQFRMYYRKRSTNYRTYEYTDEIQSIWNTYENAKARYTDKAYGDYLQSRKQKIAELVERTKYDSRPSHVQDAFTELIVTLQGGMFDRDILTYTSLVNEGVALYEEDEIEDEDT